MARSALFQSNRSFIGRAATFAPCTCSDGMTDASLWNLSIIAARTAIVLVALGLGIRVFGKREMGGMTVIDLVVVLALANAVQNAMTLGSGVLLVGIVSGGTLLLLDRLLGLALVRRPSLERFLTGGPV